MNPYVAIGSFALVVLVAIVALEKGVFQPAEIRNEARKKRHRDAMRGGAN